MVFTSFQRFSKVFYTALVDLRCLQVFKGFQKKFTPISLICGVYKFSKVFIGFQKFFTLLSLICGVNKFSKVFKSFLHLWCLQVFKSFQRFSKVFKGFQRFSKVFYTSLVDLWCSQVFQSFQRFSKAFYTSLVDLWCSQVFKSFQRFSKAFYTSLVDLWCSQVFKSFQRFQKLFTPLSLICGFHRFRTILGLIVKGVHALCAKNNAIYGAIRMQYTVQVYFINYK